MKRSILVAALTASALVPVAAPTPAAAQVPTCLATYQDKVIHSHMGQVVEYEPPQTVYVYPGNAIAPVVYLANATIAFVDCVVPGA